MSEKPTFEDLTGEGAVDSWSNTASNSEISTVSNLAIKQLKLANELAELEGAVKAKKEELRLTTEQELPDAMQQAGLTEIVLSSGEKISISEFYSPHISKANQ